MTRTNEIKDLDKANDLIELLRSELEETQRGITSLVMEAERNKQLYENIFHNAIEGLFQIEKSGKRFLIVNNALAEMMGFNSSREMMDSVQDIGKELIAVEQDFLNLLREARHTHRVQDYELEVKTSEQEERRWVSVSLYAYYEEGELKNYEGFVLDIHARKQYEQELQEALKEKDILLAEIHHRVKNNLAVISGILELQSFQTENEQTNSALIASTKRIKSMALIHELLYKNDRFSEIELDIFINDLIELSKVGFITDDQDLTINVDCDVVNVDLNQAIPCALFINEVLVNSIRHGFPNHRDGEITITIKRKDDFVRMILKDNGVGYDPAEVDPMSGTSGLGTELMKIFTSQLKGDLKVHSESGKGTQVELSFKLERITGSSANYKPGLDDRGTDEQNF